MVRNIEACEARGWYQVAAEVELPEPMAMESTGLSVGKDPPDLEEPKRGFMVRK